jgi:hypothetical protein
MALFTGIAMEKWVSGFSRARLFARAGSSRFRHPRRFRSGFPGNALQKRAGLTAPGRFKRTHGRLMRTPGRLMRTPGALFMAFLLAVPVISCVSIDPAKRYPNMVADRDPISAGAIEAQFDKFLASEVEKKEAAVIFYPRDNTVALEFRYQLVRYRQIWDLRGRQRFIQALDRYKADYAARNLTEKFSRTRAVYGKFKGATEWETFSISQPGTARPVMELGYRFKGKSPYFSVVQKAAPDEYSLNSNEPRADSLPIIMYYTRAQADELAKLFDQSYLLSLLGPPVDAAPGQDDYQDEP